MKRSLIEKAEELLSRETGTIHKDPGGRVSVCLVYPNTYHVGMSNLGFQGLYTLLNERDDVVCERAFMPDPEDMEEYERTGTEVFALESKRPLGRFDIVAFSVSFENDYLNILRILRMANIPLESAERGLVHPLVLMGGACAFANPEPVAEFIDICFIGEAEEMLGEFMDVYAASVSKEDAIKKAKNIEGVYVPQFYEVSYGPEGFISGRTAGEGAPEVIRRRYVTDISKYPVRASIITPDTEFRRMYLVEAMRGCPHSCSFCLAGHVYGPPRRKPLKAIKKEIKEALQRTERVGLIGPSLTDYAHALDVLKMEGVDFSITSLRASPRSAEIVGLMQGKKSVSIAPEAGTDRLRKVINKKITEDDIIETSRLILSGGVERLRLYFMIGLPGETQEDIDGIIDIVKKIRDASPKGSITLTLSTFVPKPFTPFQWHPMEELKTVKDRIKHVKKSLGPVKGVKVFHDVPKYAYMQGMLSMGDRRVAGALKSMLDDGDWTKAARSAGVDPDFYTIREKSPDEILPWDFIDTGISKKKLLETYRKSFSQGDSETNSPVDR
jgi:radical SAM superfamily enzyme YgiQ (UPF0313 family)